MMDIFIWLVPWFLHCFSLIFGMANSHLLEDSRIRLYMSERNKKLALKEENRQLKHDEISAIIRRYHPQLLNLKTHPNYYIHDPPITERVAYVFLHQPMAGDETMRHCLDLIKDKNGFTDSTEFTPEIRLKWDTLNASNYRNKFDLHQGHFAFGVCNTVLDKHCAYLTMLREPFDRLRALFERCRVHPGDVWCRNTDRVTMKQFFLNHGSSVFRQLVAGLENCMDDHNSLSPCWVKQKIAFDDIPHQEKLLDYVLENLENWFSVIGIYEDFDESLQMLAHAHRMPFDSCSRIDEESAAVDLADMDEILNGGRESPENAALRTEIKQLKNDAEVLAALKPDLMIYKQASNIFRRQRQLFKNLL